MYTKQASIGKTDGQELYKSSPIHRIKVKIFAILHL